MNEYDLLNKPLKRITLVNWSRFGAVQIRINGATLLTGENGIGKSTIFDAISYALTGNQKFNTAANDKDRTVLRYVRGDTSSNGDAKYLRSGMIISYIALEFYSPSDKFNITVGVCVESTDERTFTPNWFVIKDAGISDINFYTLEGTHLTVTPKNELKAKGVRLKATDFMKKEKGVAQIQRALGIRCENPDEYRRKLVKLISFKDENNINDFISDSVLPEVEITTLSELREMKAQYDKLIELSENIRKKQMFLEDVEKVTQAYETKAVAYDLKCAEQYWQKYAVSQKKNNENRSHIEKLKEEHIRLKKEYDTYEEELVKAQDRLTQANIALRDSNFEAVIEGLKKQILETEAKLRQADNDIARITSLKTSVENIINYLDMEPSVHDAVRTLNTDDGTADVKYSVIRKIKERLGHKTDEYKEARWEINGTIKEKEDKLAELGQQIRQLENEQKSFPGYVLKAKDLINEELRKRGIDAKVRIFAELIEDIKVPEWRNAIEAYLNKKRFDLIIDGEYVDDALEIFHDLKLGEPSLVLTDKLEDMDADSNSAATLLSIPNIFAKRYANFLLGRIYLCNNLRELHDHPLGGIMKDGTLAKSYTVRNLPVNKVDYYIGQEAIKLQLEKVRKEHSEIKKEHASCKQKSEELTKYIMLLGSTEIDTSVRFEALTEHSAIATKLARLNADLKAQNDNPTFKALNDAIISAQAEYNDVNNKKQEAYHKEQDCANDIKTREERTAILEKEEAEAKAGFESFIFQHLELRKRAVDEYERLSKNGTVLEPITQKLVDEYRREAERAVREMEDAQVKYCVAAGLNTDERGVAYIGKYRKEKEKVVNIDAENNKQKIIESKNSLESTFVVQFVGAICEALTQYADEGLAKLNRNLADYPFGNDIYSFTKKPRKDLETFFKIKKKIYDNSLSIENEYNQNLDNEELRNDIRELMDEILLDTGNNDYTDYRKYYIYDMKIENTAEHVDANLSNKYGSSSGGEKKTPYYIILAASLIQCYPKNTSCARLALIDEAYAELDPQRVKQMVRYFNQNGLQAIYAAPPDKINTIGNYIETTISLVKTERFTNIVEGLTDEYRREAEKHKEDVVE